MNITNNNLFDYKKTIASKLFDTYKYPWELLPNISDFINNFVPSDDYYVIDGNQFIHKSVKLYNNITIEGSCIICEGTTIRPGAFLRGNVIVGKDCVVGNSTEIKNSIILDNAQMPHYNYIGDSIIGNHSHLGAGAICSNLKSDKSNIVIKNEGCEIKTGLRKIGAILADNVEVGCGSVLNPGTIIMKSSMIYPVSMVRGIVREKSIYKDKANIVDIL